ncbi:MAG: hypothetical protein IJB96_12920 [Lachnospira sp.]|nr:hypothetical protein [Lachnospira sp.]
MRKTCVIFICLAIILCFAACNGNVEFTENENKTIATNSGTEYTYVGNEGNVWCFGEWEFVGHVVGEKKTFSHLADKIKTGMYSVDGGKDVLVRYLSDNEYASIYVKSDLLKTEVKLENCIRYEFVKGTLSNDSGILNSKKGIFECEKFLNEIKNGQKAEDAGLSDLVKQPDGMLKNCYVYGYVYGIVQENLNLVIPLEVISYDDKAYSIKIDGKEYVLLKDWLDKLITE